jgi:hypothetical protein
VAKKQETVLKEKVLADLKKLPNTYAVKIQQETIHGTPDILICCRGLFVALELKKGQKDKADHRQLYELNIIEKAGGIGFVADPLNWPDILAKLTALSHGITAHEAPVL